MSEPSQAQRHFLLELQGSESDLSGTIVAVNSCNGVDLMVDGKVKHLHFEDGNFAAIASRMPLGSKLTIHYTQGVKQ
jgi:hypothetical protein